MSDIRGYVQNLAPGRTINNLTGLRATSDGALYTASNILAAGIEGRIFGANMGVVTTPVTTAATTAITDTIAHGWVRVLDGTVIIPLSCVIVIESSGATTQIEGSIVIAQNDIGTSGAAAAAGPICLNSAAPVSSLCLARQLATASTAPTNPIELKRFSAAASAVNTTFEWKADDGPVFPVVRGAGSWAFYLGGNAVVYYGQMIWAEFPEQYFV